MAPTPDHRPRVGAHRRARTRDRLIQAAIPVFAAKGVEAPVIDDVIKIAGVSRGTFYNHFQSNQDLLLALNHQLREELVLASRRAVADLSDPVEQIATCLAMLINFARDTPLLAQFVSQIGLEAAGPEHMLSGFMASLIRAAKDQGRVPDIPVLAALDMVAGAVLFAFYRIAKGESPPDHGTEVIATVLRGLGLPLDEATALATRLADSHLPDMTDHPDCALIQSTARAGTAPKD